MLLIYVIFVLTLQWIADQWRLPFSNFSSGIKLPFQEVWIPHDQTFKSIQQVN